MVHYRTPDLAAAAVAALRAADGTRADNDRLEIVVVDNGSTAQERARLEALPARYLDAGGNRGYAGGVNLGVAATDAELVALMNPDVEVPPGSLDALFAALEDGQVAAAGPRLWWDRARTFQLPPTERRRPTVELRTVLALRGGAWAREARAAWRAHARPFRTATTPFASYELSGALLAVRRDAWDRLGPFDEGYRLYFEETEWLDRARRAGLEARYVPAAEAVHGFARSSAGEPRAAAWFEASARRFRRACYGRGFARLLESAHERLTPPSPPWPAPFGIEDTAPRARSPLWIEASISPLGFPAAARRLEVESIAEGIRNGDLLALPDALHRRLDGAPYALRLVDDRGVELALRIVNRPDDQNRSQSPLA